MSGAVLLSDAPRESDLGEPFVDRDRLRPHLFRDAAGKLSVPVCDMPIEYSLGRIDPRFELGRKQALAGIARAAGFWEAGIGKPLFLYNPDSAFVIDFVFDERQEMLIKMKSGRDSVADVRKRFDALEAERAALLADHDVRVRAYEAEIARWNDQGGAPPDEKRALDADKQTLQDEAEVINDMLSRINALARDINSRDGHPGGEYAIVAGRTDRQVTNDLVTALHMNIYMFQTWDQLALIVAHELGHSLGLQHVPSQGSLMFGGPTPVRQSQPSAEDVAELHRVCPEH
jgi:hypothetical protein